MQSVEEVIVEYSLFNISKIFFSLRFDFFILHLLL